MARSIAWLLALAVILGVTSIGAAASDVPEYGDITGPVTATSMGIRLPKTQAEFRRMTSAQKERAEAALYARLPEWVVLLDAGQVNVNEVTGLAATLRPLSASIRGLARPMQHATSASGQCQVQWSNSGSGTWLRGYGKTTANDAVQLISVEVSFYKDGGLVVPTVGAGCSGGGDTCPGLVESVTDWTWRWSWDHHTWTTYSVHTVRRADGVYLLGPSAPCSTSLNQ